MADVVWAVRHGERRDSVDPEWESTAERPHDPPLTELGRWAAWRVGRRLADADVGFDAVYASPFLRTVETAAEICDELDRRFRLEPGLGEHRNAEWFDAEPETLPVGELADRFPRIDPGHEPLATPSFPERHPEALARVGETARRLVGATEGPLLLVGHGLTIGGVVDGLAGSADGADAPLCGLTRLSRGDDGWRLDFSGDTAHLDE
ncbi:histidine phosphatase family protein [Halobaculum sp. EA56]|uniref:histidine phosphatase family protein n=1 Tax=Halobaculum sp. EA56 TaxID=3421648 RepID=UPI003EBDB095